MKQLFFVLIAFFMFTAVNAQMSHHHKKHHRHHPHKHVVVHHGHKVVVHKKPGHAFNIVADNRRRIIA